MSEVLAFSIPEFCKGIGISVRTFYNLDDRGEAPPTCRIGARRLIRREAAEAWLQEREQAE